MKYAFFTPTCNVGGYERVVLNLANYLLSKHNDVIIICGNKDGELVSLFNKKIKIISLNTRAKKMLIPLCKVIKEENPDCIYVGFRFYNVLCTLACKIVKTNTIICISQHGYEKNTKIIEILLGKILSKSDIFFGVSDSIIDYEKKSLKLKCNKFFQLNNPVIDKKIKIPEIKDTWFDGNYIIVSCGRLSIDKNVILAVKILERLIVYNCKVKLLIIGDGSEKNNLVEYVKKRNLSKYIRFVGYCDNPLMYMKKCNLYIHTCKKEGFGNTVVEALYCDLPIITTNCGGPVDIIEKKYGVCIGSYDDPKIIENGCKAILDYINGLKQINGLNEKANDYNIENVGNKFETILKEYIMYEKNS